MNRLSLLTALGGIVLVSGAACVLPSYEGSAGEGGEGGSTAPGGLTTTSSTPTSNGSTSTAATNGSSAIGASSGAEATSSASVASSSGSDVASSSSSDAASSSSSGTPCLLALPACGNVEAYDFMDQPGLEQRFDIDQPEARVMGGKLKLDPEDAEAVLKAKEDATFDADCAIWVALSTTNADGTSGLGLGDGSLQGAQLRVARDGEQLVSHALSGAEAQVAFDEEAMRHVRIRVIAGDAYLDYAAEKSCWTQLSGPHDRSGDKPTMFHTGNGNAQLDDYCID